MCVAEYWSHALISLMRNIHEKLLMITVSEVFRKLSSCRFIKVHWSLISVYRNEEAKRNVISRNMCNWKLLICFRQ